MPRINRPVGEKEIRAALLTRLRASAAATSGATLLEEKQFGRSRIDVMCMSNRLDGFEIKSDYDSLTRLATQVESFSCTFDTMTLVVGHELFKDALIELPKWWGILRAERGRLGGVRFDQMRAAKANPNDTRLGLAGLLWRNELMDAYEPLTGIKPAKSTAGNRLRAKIAASAGIEALRTVVLNQLQFPERLAALQMSRSVPRVSDGAQAQAMRG